MGPSGVMGYIVAGGSMNDMSSLDDVGNDTSELSTGLTPSGLEEFPTLGLPLGLVLPSNYVEKQGYKVTDVDCIPIFKLCSLYSR